MYKLVRKWGKKYVPDFLKPLAYKLYFFVIYLISTVKYHYVISRIKNEKILFSLAKEKIIQIIQPSFYSLDGSLYLSGGAERYLYDLSQIIKSLGYTPVIVQYGTKFFHLKHHDIDVIGIPSGINNFVLNKVAHNKIFGQPLLRIYSPFTFGYPAQDKNSIGISHGIFWDHPQYKSVENVICKPLLNLPTLVSVDTITLMWFRIAMAGKIAGKDMRYIPNYVDLEEFCPIKRPENKNLIITIPRRLYMQRGYFLVENIIPNILKKHKNVEFHFVGQIDESVKDDVAKLLAAFPKNVTIYQQKDTLMHEVYKKSDITLIPTVASEGTSLSCLEAMATGNAIIATNIGGLPNLIISGYNGILISPNPVELEEALEQLLSNPNLRKTLGEKARSTAQAFDKKIWAEKWRNLLIEKLK